MPAERYRSCPLPTDRIISEYFIENRTRLLDIAAFLDRIDRAADAPGAAADFRLTAFHSALAILADDDNQKIERIQLLFSDPTVDPKAQLDTKSACGAWNPNSEKR